MECRIGRFHNIYGPFGTWKGGREKAPAAFCRKAITSTTEFEMWGNGKQTRSFCYIDDCVEGILRLMVSDYKKPLNIGSDEMVSSTADGLELPTRCLATAWLLLGPCLAAAWPLPLLRCRLFAPATGSERDG